MKPEQQHSSGSGTNAPQLPRTRQQARVQAAATPSKPPARQEVNTPQAGADSLQARLAKTTISSTDEVIHRLIDMVEDCQTELRSLKAEVQETRELAVKVEDKYFGRKFQIPHMHELAHDCLRKLLTHAASKRIPHTRFSHIMHRELSQLKAEIEPKGEDDDDEEEEDDDDRQKQREGEGEIRDEGQGIDKDESEKCKRCKEEKEAKVSARRLGWCSSRAYDHPSRGSWRRDRGRTQGWHGRARDTSGCRRGLRVPCERDKVDSHVISDRSGLQSVVFEVVVLSDPSQSAWFESVFEVAVLSYSSYSTRCTHST